MSNLGGDGALVLHGFTRVVETWVLVDQVCGEN